MKKVKNNNQAPCPCFSSLPYISCCAKYHKRTDKPETAEQLMRSRYTAYHMDIVDYLVMTTHPDKLRPIYRTQLESTKGDTEWVGLEILSTSMGSKTDKIGKVHFLARYIMNGKEEEMEEHSRFRRYQGDWVYYDEKG